MKNGLKIAVILLLLAGSIWGIVNHFRLCDSNEQLQVLKEENEYLSKRRSAMAEVFYNYPKTDEEQAIYEKNVSIVIENGFSRGYAKKLADLLWWFHRSGDVSDSEIIAISEQDKQDCIVTTKDGEKYITLGPEITMFWKESDSEHMLYAWIP